MGETGIDRSQRDYQVIRASRLPRRQWVIRVAQAFTIVVVLAACVVFGLWYGLP